jgi:DNA replication protein DnaC
MMQAWEIDGKEPVIRPSDLRLWDRGLVWLDEFGKVKQSDFSARMTFELIDIAYEEQQQIVIATNLSRTELRSYWAEQGDQYSGAIYRRLFDQTNIISVNFGNPEEA